MYVYLDKDSLTIQAVLNFKDNTIYPNSTIVETDINIIDFDFVVIYRDDKGNIIIQERSDEEKQRIIQQRLERAKQQKKQEIANIRYECETSGITYNNAEIATDRVSQSKIAGAIQYFDLNPNVTTIPWKAKNGWFNFTKDDMIAIAKAVADHIEECFMKEKELFEQIDNAQTMEDLVKIQWNT